MQRAEYIFITHWKFDTEIEKVYAAIHDAGCYHLWWKGQGKVESIREGDELGVGTIKRFRTRSFLPYSLLYDGTVTAVEPLKRIEGKTEGDLKGHGIWIFERENGITHAQYTWVVKTNALWMNFLAPVAKPFFEWNHNLVMKWGGKGLANYLQCHLLD